MLFFCINFDKKDEATSVVKYNKICCYLVHNIVFNKEKRGINE